MIVCPLKIFLFFRVEFLFIRFRNYSFTGNCLRQGFELIGVFNVLKGVFQGDPLSQFWFWLESSFLSHCVNEINQVKRDCSKVGCFPMNKFYNSLDFL